MKVALLLALVALEVALGQYCFQYVGPTTTVDSNLGIVSLNGKSRTILENTICPGVVGPIDGTNQVADLIPGFSYSLSYQVVTCGAEYPTLSGAWIDYDGNSQFDSNELIGDFNTSRGTITVNFTVINDTSRIKYGTTRLRVQVQETSQITIDPCASFPYGGTKDFSIDIISEFPGYCNSGPTSTLDAQLGQVGLKGDSRSIIENTGCSNNTGPFNFTNITADLTIGNSYEINYTIISCDTQFSTTSTAWIDYNQNQAFDHWEQIFPFSKRFGFQAFSFKVPKSTSSEVVKSGLTRMRVQVQETSASDIDPCSLFSYGGTKDFGVDIKDVVDGGWGSWGACNASCGGGYQVRKCDNPPPSQEGALCVGSNVTTCNTDACSGSTSGSNGGKVAAGILIPLIVIGALVAFWFYRKRKASMGEFADDFTAEQTSETPAAGQTSSYQTAS